MYKTPSKFWYSILGQNSASHTRVDTVDIWAVGIPTIGYSGVLEVPDLGVALSVRVPHVLSEYHVLESDGGDALQNLHLRGRRRHVIAHDTSGRVRFTCAGWASEPKLLTSPAQPCLQAQGEVAPLRRRPAARVNRTRPVITQKMDLAGFGKLGKCKMWELF